MAMDLAALKARFVAAPARLGAAGGARVTGVDTGPLAPSVCFGSVMHARFAPLYRRFDYPVFFLRLPLSRLEELSSPWLGIERRAVMRVLYRDHGARDGSHPLPWIRALLAREGLACADGEVVLHAMPRLLGYVFNPVSFWFCHDRVGALRAVLCEVNNTFGERHGYLVAHADARAIARGDRLHARKCFHVSPFFPVSGDYSFRFTLGVSAYAVAIDYAEEGQRLLATRVAGRAAALTPANLARAALRYPLLTLAVVARIHWQALCLWARRVPFFPKPEPPREEVSR